MGSRFESAFTWAARFESVCKWADNLNWRVNGQTRVHRVLLGDPGVTYRYKDLRLFAVPWSAPPGAPVRPP